MEFLVGETPDFRGGEELETLEIDTLEEFLAFVSMEGAECSVIVHPPQGDEPWKLEVYTDYRE